MAVEAIALGVALARAVVSLLLRHVLALAADLARVLGPPQTVRRLRVRDGAMGVAEFEERVLRPGVPVLLEGFDLGTAPSLWSSPEALMELCGDKLVSVHASAEADLEWLQKNFEFAVMPFSELVRRVWPAAAIPPAAAPPALSTEPGAPSPTGAARFFYLRSVGEKMRTQPADFGRSFPRLAETIALPAPYPPAAFFSSALRVGSAGLSLWTHNDVMENLLVHVVGHKRVTLWPPSCARELGVRGSASDCGAAEHAKWARSPALALCRARASTAQLRPGDVLYIPPLWYHHVSSLTASVSVNVFWRGLPQDRYARKDLYGNRDPIGAESAMQAARAAGSALREAALPPAYFDFYAERLRDALEEGLLPESAAAMPAPARRGAAAAAAADVARTAVETAQTAFESDRLDRDDSGSPATGSCHTQAETSVR